MALHQGLLQHQQGLGDNSMLIGREWSGIIPAAVGKLAIEYNQPLIYGPSYQVNFMNCPVVLQNARQDQPMMQG
ncbi:hypothetical protein ES703_11594 [subsurface metagenome]